MANSENQQTGPKQADSDTTGPSAKAEVPVFNDREKYNVAWKETKAGFAIGYTEGEDGKPYMLVAKNDNIFADGPRHWYPVARYRNAKEWDESVYAESLAGRDEENEVDITYYWLDQEEESTKPEA